MKHCDKKHKQHDQHNGKYNDVGVEKPIMDESKGSLTNIVLREKEVIPMVKNLTKKSIRRIGMGRESEAL